MKLSFVVAVSVSSSGRWKKKTRKRTPEKSNCLVASKHLKNTRTRKLVVLRYSKKASYQTVTCDDFGH